MEENNESKKKMNFKINKTMLLVVGLIMLTGLLLALSLSAKKVSPLPIISNNDSEKSVAQTELSISEQPRASSTSGVYEVDVEINTNTNKVTGVQIELSYDPKVLKDVDIKIGDFLLDPVTILKKVDTKLGRISFVLGSQLGEPGIDGQGVIATIVFNKVGNAQTAIDFLPQTLVSAEGSDQSVLKDYTSGMIGILPESSTSAR